MVERWKMEAMRALKRLAGGVEKLAEELERYNDQQEEHELPLCPHGHGEMIKLPSGEPLEPDSPWCETCGHIHGRPCSDGCDYNDD